MTSKNPLLNAAMDALERGWSFLPIHAGNLRDKDPHSTLLIKAGFHRPNPETGKIEATWKPLQTVRPTEEHIRIWFSQPSQVGMALITGAISDRIIIDFDGQEGKDLAFDLGIRAHVKTGGGLHWHIKHPGFHVYNLVGKNAADSPFPSVDVRGDRGNAVLPPTVTRKGPYQYLRDPDDPDELRDVPDELRAALRLYPAVTLKSAAPTSTLPADGKRYPMNTIIQWAIARVQQGHGRNDTGHMLAWVLFNNGYSMDEVRHAGPHYLHAVSHLKSPPYTLDEYLHSAASAARAPRGEPWGLARGDSTSRPITPGQTAASVLERVYSSLSPDDQLLGAQILASEWCESGKPIEQTIAYLRLIGHAQAARTARAAYTQPSVQTTLQAFLHQRRINYGG